MKKKFGKGSFVYDESTDTYTCPAGKKLTCKQKYRGNDRMPGYIQYETNACAECPLRERCTSRKGGRQVRRFQDDDLKDALRTVMSHPKARLRYKQRQAMVEPVYSEIKGIQGLRRFRRRGLTGVKVEFGLHVMAHNLRRAAVVFVAFICVLMRLLAQKRMSGSRPLVPTLPQCNLASGHVCLGIRLACVT
jgi:hypothetical protein